MKKTKIIISALLVCAVGYFLYLPKSIEAVLNRIEFPFEVGEIVAIQEIEENTTVVHYINKKQNQELQNVVIRKQGPFYREVDLNGSLIIEKPKTLELGDIRTQVHISWYDKSEKYVVMSVAYDEDVASVVYRDKELENIEFNGYNLFYGYGIGDYKVYKIYDVAGKELTQIKE